MYMDFARHGPFHIQHQRQRLLSQRAMAGLWPAVSINPASHAAPHYHYLSNIPMAVQASGQLYQLTPLARWTSYNRYQTSKGPWQAVTIN